MVKPKISHDGYETQVFGQKGQTLGIGILVSWILRVRINKTSLTKSHLEIWNAFELWWDLVQEPVDYFPTIPIQSSNPSPRECERVPIKSILFSSNNAPLLYTFLFLLDHSIHVRPYKFYHHTKIHNSLTTLLQSRHSYSKKDMVIPTHKLCSFQKMSIVFFSYILKKFLSVVLKFCRDGNINR